MSARDRFAATYLLSESATRRRKKRHKSGSEYSYVGSELSYSSSRKGHARVQSSPMLHSRDSSPRSLCSALVFNWRSVQDNVPPKDYKERKRRRRREDSYSATASIASLNLDGNHTLRRRFVREQSASTGHLLENRKQRLRPNDVPPKARSHTGASTSTFTRLTGDRNRADPPKDRKTKKRRSNQSEKNRSDGGLSTSHERLEEERKLKKKKRSDHHTRSDRGRSGSNDPSEEERKTKKKKRRSDQSDKSRSEKRRSDESKGKQSRSEKALKRRSDESKRKNRRRDKQRSDEIDELTTQRSNQLKRMHLEAEKRSETKEDPRLKHKSETSKRRSGETQRNRNSGSKSIIDSVKNALDEEYKKKHDHRKSKRKHTTDTHDTIGSIATIEAYNLIDERLLEDIPPRKLSFLKAEAERKYEQSEKRIRRKWRNHEHNLSEADIRDVQTYGEGFRSAQMQRIKNLIPKRPQAYF